MLSNRDRKWIYFIFFLMLLGAQCTSVYSTYQGKGDLSSVSAVIMGLMILVVLAANKDLQGWEYAMFATLGLYTVVLALYGIYLNGKLPISTFGFGLLTSMVNMLFETEVIPTTGSILTVISCFYLIAKVPAHLASK